jgi:hypothetical protein
LFQRGGRFSMNACTPSERSVVHHIAGHRLTCCLVRSCDPHIRFGDKEFLADRDCGPRFGQNRRDQLLKFGVQLLRLCNAVHQTACLRFVSADEFAGHKHLKRLLRSTFRDTARRMVTSKTDRGSRR